MGYRRYSQSYPYSQAQEEKESQSNNGSINRIEFSIQGLDNAIQGGVPETFWVSLFGPPGSLKTLHSLSLAVNALNNGMRVLYVATETTKEQLLQQIESLGWDLPPDIRVDIVYSSTTRGRIEELDFGIIDRDSLWFYSKAVSSIMASSRSKYRKKYGIFDMETLIGALWMGLQSINVFSYRDVIDKRVLKSDIRIRDALRGERSIYLNRDIHAVVIIDSITPFFVHAPSMAGRILSTLRIQFDAPNVTYIITNNVPKDASSEYGALIGHVVDGRIMLWYSLEKDEVNYYGVVLKMRNTNHSRKVHKILIADETVKELSDGMIIQKKKLVWVPKK